MFIQEFYTSLTCTRTRSRLFDALRRLNRLEIKALDLKEDGWPSWPIIICPDPGVPKP